MRKKRNNRASSSSQWLSLQIKKTSIPGNIDLMETDLTLRENDDSNNGYYEGFHYSEGV